MSASRVALLGGLALALTAVDAVPRQLQAAGKPDKCTDDASFQAWLAVANQACCTKTEATCTNGLPSDCDSECANIMIPMKKNCKTQLQNGGLWDTVNTVSSKCPKLPKGQHKGCPKNIPSVSDMNAEQACGSGDGFWPTGSTCAVSCAAPGGGHRRVQAGASVDYVCTQGGNWVSTGPIDCRLNIHKVSNLTSPLHTRPGPMPAFTKSQMLLVGTFAAVSFRGVESQMPPPSAPSGAELVPADGGGALLCRRQGCAAVTNEGLPRGVLVESGCTEGGEAGALCRLGCSEGFEISDAADGRCAPGASAYEGQAADRGCLLTHGGDQRGRAAPPGDSLRIRPASH